MDAISCKTRSISSKSMQKNWWIVDAKDQIVGRLATRIAHYLRGKHKPQYTPHLSCGDSIVVINASGVCFSGRKWRNKSYVRYTGYPGGQRSMNAHLLHEKHPTRVLEYAIKGMLPKNKLGRALFRNVYIYPYEVHRHEAQHPQTFPIR